MMVQNIEHILSVCVSIVIPIYKVEAYIADCLQSVCAQTYSQLEVILVNDATPDDSMEQAAPWIEKLRERFEVKVVTHEHNRGLSAARNTGINEATGGWIYFLDSDDEITPNCIELLVKEVEKHPDVDFVIGNVEFVGATWLFPLKCAPYVKKNENILHDFTTYKWYMMAVNRLYSKKYIVQHHLYFKEGLLHEDELYSFQVATTAKSMAAVYENTYIYKVRTEGSITAHLTLKNFNHKLCINQEKFAYILEQYRSGIYVIPCQYCIDCIYGYTITLIENHSVKQKDKVKLLKSLQTAFIPLNPYIKGRLTLKQELLRRLYKMPAGMVLQFIKLHLEVLDLRK